MSRYHHRKDGTPVTAIQFTDFISTKQMEREFKCKVTFCHNMNDSYILVDGVGVWRGQYAVQAFPAIVAMDQKTFDERFKLDETQLELFKETK